MSLVTRCPGCGTAFRVLPSQLSARAGRVRCGKCGEVFDGISALVEVSPQAPLPAAAPHIDLSEPRQADEGHSQEPLPEFMAEPAPRRRALWGTLSALALLVLIGQAIFAFRSELALAFPSARPALARACEALGCELPLPRRLGLLSIDSYEVRADPRREGAIVLNAVIRNRAPFNQAYPALHFTLTDEAQRRLASRSILPREYLEAERATDLIERGLEANGEAALTLYFDASHTPATGYELVLFYPS